MLALEKVKVSLGNFKLCADWSVTQGHRVAVIGPSGAGKSTLLSAIAGFTPHQGRITVGGQDITTLRPEDRGIAMLFQDGNLFPHLTLAQNVGLGLRGTLRLNAQELDQVYATLKRVGLAGLEHRRPGDVSGGQQGRTALARAPCARQVAAAA